jgi:dimeric dUTPase (all-alpha-NTP-PPase superfamily)
MVKIDLNSLKELQKALDQKIYDKHHIAFDKTINERILAFQVELGELANETRCFKYWSLKEASSRDIILEEYVDGIHFLVSLSLYFDFDLRFNAVSKYNDLTQQFLTVFKDSALLNDDFSLVNIIKLFEEYLSLGIMLDFDNDTIIKGYKDKNETNHQRQENDY